MSLSSLSSAPSPVFSDLHHAFHTRSLLLERENPPPEYRNKGSKSLLLPPPPLSPLPSVSHFISLYMDYISLSNTFISILNRLFTSHPQWFREVKLVMEMTIARAIQVKQIAMEMNGTVDGENGNGNGNGGFGIVNEMGLPILMVSMREGRKGGCGDLELEIPQWLREEIDIKVEDNEEEEEGEKEKNNTNNESNNDTNRTLSPQFVSHTLRSSRHLLHSLLSSPSLSLPPLRFPHEPSPPLLNNKITREMAVRIIQRNERSRQAMEKIKKAKEEYHKNYSKSLGNKKVSKRPNPMLSRDKAVMMIQRVVRGWIGRRRAREKRWLENKKMGFIRKDNQNGEGRGIDWYQKYSTALPPYLAPFLGIPMGGNQNKNHNSFTPSLLLSQSPSTSNINSFITSSPSISPSTAPSSSSASLSSLPSSLPLIYTHFSSHKSHMKSSLVLSPSELPSYHSYQYRHRLHYTQLFHYVYHRYPTLREYYEWKRSGCKDFLSDSEESKQKREEEEDKKKSSKTIGGRRVVSSASSSSSNKLTSPSKSSINNSKDAKAKSKKDEKNIIAEAEKEKRRLDTSIARAALRSQLLSTLQEESNDIHHISLTLLPSWKRSSYDRLTYDDDTESDEESHLRGKVEEEKGKGKKKKRKGKGKGAKSDGMTSGEESEGGDNENGKAKKKRSKSKSKDHSLITIPPTSPPFPISLSPPPFLSSPHLNHEDVVYVPPSPLLPRMQFAVKRYLLLHAAAMERANVNLNYNENTNPNTMITVSPPSDQTPSPSSPIISRWLEWDLRRSLRRLTRRRVDEEITKYIKEKKKEEKRAEKERKRVKMMEKKKKMMRKMKGKKGNDTDDTNGENDKDANSKMDNRNNDGDDNGNLTDKEGGDGGLTSGDDITSAASASSSSDDSDSHDNGKSKTEDKDDKTDKEDNNTNTNKSIPNILPLFHCCEGETLCHSLSLADMITALAKAGILTIYQNHQNTSNGNVHKDNNGNKGDVKGAGGNGPLSMKNLPLNTFKGDFHLTPQTSASSISSLSSPPPSVDPSAADIRALIKENIIFPLSSPSLRSLLSSPSLSTSTLLLFGLQSTGKSHLTHSISYETHSALFDLSPSLLLPKLIGSTKNDIHKLIHMIYHVAYMVQPSVIFMDEVEKIFMGIGEEEGKEKEKETEKGKENESDKDKDNKESEKKGEEVKDEKSMDNVTDNDKGNPSSDTEKKSAEVSDDKVNEIAILRQSLIMHKKIFLPHIITAPSSSPSSTSPTATTPSTLSRVYPSPRILIIGNTRYPTHDKLLRSEFYKLFPPPSFGNHHISTNTTSTTTALHHRSSTHYLYNPYSLYENFSCRYIFTPLPSSVQRFLIWKSLLSYYFPIANSTLSPSSYNLFYHSLAMASEGFSYGEIQLTVLMMRGGERRKKEIQREVRRVKKRMGVADKDNGYNGNGNGDMDHDDEDNSHSDYDTDNENVNGEGWKGYNKEEEKSNDGTITMSLSNAGKGEDSDEEEEGEGNHNGNQNNINENNNGGNANANASSPSSSSSVSSFTSPPIPLPPHLPLHSPLLSLPSGLSSLSKCLPSSSADVERVRRFFLEIIGEGVKERVREKKRKSEIQKEEEERKEKFEKGKGKGGKVSVSSNSAKGNGIKSPSRVK